MDDHQTHNEQAQNPWLTEYVRQTATLSLNYSRTSYFSIHTNQPNTATTQNIQPIVVNNLSDLNDEQEKKVQHQS